MSTGTLSNVCFYFAGTLTGLFYEMEHSDDELVRERCIRFLHSRVRVLGPQVLTPDVENLIVTESKKVLQVGPFLLIM